MSEIGDLESPRGAMTTRVDPKLFGKPADFLGDRREWRHFEWVFRNWFGFLYDAVEEWLDEAAVSVVELGEAVPTRRDMSLAMVCKDGALDVVKGVAGKRGFECWRSFTRSSMVLRLGRRCRSIRIFWSMTLGRRMASRRNC